MGLDFFEFFQESPGQATAILIIMLAIFVLCFCVTKYLEHKEKER